MDFYLPNLQEEQWKEFSEERTVGYSYIGKEGDTPFVKFDGYHQAVYQTIMNHKD